MKRFLERYLGGIVLGAFDGTVTTFAIVAAAYGAGLKSSLVVVLGVANLLADGFSMGSSAYLAVKSDRDLKNRDGRPRRLARKQSGDSPLLSGLMTFASFVAVGTAVIICYAIDLAFNLEQPLNRLFVMSLIATGLIFLIVGSLKARVTGTNFVRAVTETLALGAAAALLGYFSGDFLSGLLGVR